LLKDLASLGVDAICLWRFRRADPIDGQIPYQNGGRDADAEEKTGLRVRGNWDPQALDS